MRRPRLTSAWCTAACASSAGTAARSALRPRSVRMISALPRSTAAHASSAIVCRRASNASTPPPAANSDVDRHRLQRRRAASCASSRRRQNRRAQHDARRARRELVDEAAVSAEHRRQRHDRRFAVRIDRRVGDLREALPEEIGEQPRPRDSAAGGASSPIEPIASWPSAIIGLSSSSISSREQPNAACRRDSVDAASR